MTAAPSDPSRATRALADFALGPQTRVADTSRPLAWLSPEEMDINLSDPVQRRFGDYELLEKIGQGGMGVVYRARQHGLERDVAIKLLAAGPWASEEFVARFRREARSAARMQHPNIVEIYEFGHRDGLNYFSMRLIEGQTLAQRIAAKGPLPPLEAARLLRTLAEAMDYAHRLGVLHLDLKPANILLTQTGEPLIADFGLARRIDAGHDGGTEISGTPSYMAPEQAQLESHPLTASTDIHGLGAILYEVLTGKPPFTASNVQETLMRVITAVPESTRLINPSVPADLDAISLQCLEKQPGDRYATARELAEDLGNFLAKRPVTVRVPGLWERTQRWWEHRQNEVVMFLFLLIGIGATTKEWLRADRAFAEARVHQVAALQQSARSEQLAKLIAQAFPVPKGRDPQPEMDDAAKRVVEWLASSLSGSPADQQELVLRLVDELDAANNPGAAQALFQPVVAKLGKEYRRSAMEFHLASGTPRSKVLGAILMEEDGMGADETTRQQELLADAVRAAPQDPDVLTAASFYCRKEASPCGALRAELLFARLEPANAANWALALRDDDDAATVTRLMASAAAATMIDDHYDRLWRLQREALEGAKVELPSLLRALAGRLFPEVTAVELLAYLQSSSTPVPGWLRFSRVCRPEQSAASLAKVRDACLTVGRLLAFEGRNLWTTMFGSVIVRHMVPGTEEALRARELRRQYSYVEEMRATRTPAQVRASREGLVGRELGQFPEIEVYQRSLDRSGIPRDPPADWSPENPVFLMTTQERQVFRARQDALVRENLVPAAGE